MKRSLMFATALLLAGAAAQAQTPARYALELRGGAMFPSERFSGADLGTGGGVGFAGMFRMQPHLWVYGGWDWHRFTTDEGSLDHDIEATGYSLGLEFLHPFGSARTGAWLRAGALYKHVELEDNETGSVADSGHELGWEVGAGLDIPLGGHFSLNPGMRYRTWSGEIDVKSSGALAFDMSYVTVELGLRWTPGAEHGVAALGR